MSESSARHLRPVPPTGLPEPLHQQIEHVPLRRHKWQVVPSDLTSSAASRSFVRETCARWPVPEPYEFLAVQIAAELTANAVEHGKGNGPVHISLILDADLVILTVTNSGTTATDIQAHRPEADAESGRGLLMVDHLATDWGWYRTSTGGTAVWAELALPPATEAVTDRPQTETPR
ncbi:ATP-binding protein [Streptomyces sp. NPDC087850]|uniref:ATP-binding protein n=1 Tax=Streptomyces sp. NPDC087850 TaxID=3365809 RepID=UPI00381F9734